MDRDAQVKTLLEEAENAKLWFAKYASELRSDPGNDQLLRLKELCQLEFEKRWDKLAELGVEVVSGNRLGRPRIDD